MTRPRHLRIAGTAWSVLLLGTLVWAARNGVGIERVALAAFGTMAGMLALFLLGVLGRLVARERRHPSPVSRPWETVACAAWFLLIPLGLGLLGAVLWGWAVDAGASRAGPRWMTPATWTAIACGVGAAAGWPLVQRLVARARWRAARLGGSEGAAGT